MEAIEKGDFARARSEIASIGRPALRKAMTWHLLRQTESGAGFSEITRFLTENPSWPGSFDLRRRAEAALEKETVAPQTVIAWFSGTPPLTREGWDAFIDAYRRAGDASGRAAAARRAWTSELWATTDATAFLERHGSLLRAADHRARLQALLRARTAAQARWLLSAASFSPSERAVAEVRILLQQQAGASAVDPRLAALPRSARDEPEFLLDEIIWLRRADRTAAAAARIEGEPDEKANERLWHVERSILVRRYLEDGDAARAYRLAAGHRQTDAANRAEAEFLAGWIALRRLDDPARATGHFRTLYDNVSFAISRARGAYWLGRAAAARNDSAEARRWYRAAAEHPSAFYGQLAAIELGIERFSLPRQVGHDDADAPAMARDERAAAARYLGTLEAEEPVTLLLWSLLNEAEGDAETIFVARLANDLGRPNVAVRVARNALRRGGAFFDTGFPRVPAPKDIAVEDALVQSIIRQESEFDPAAISTSNARGLMQLLPGTARAMAQAQKVPYSLARLTRDPDYNVRLGTAYLDRMLARFDGSYILAAVAYNAGPSRADDWIKRFGDPRNTSTDLLDWIEQIPFGETRNYVQRVLENLMIYRAHQGQDRLPRSLRAAWIRS